MPYFKKFLPVLIFGGIFAWVIFQVEPPKPVAEGNILSPILFFLSLFFFLTFFLNLFFQLFLRSLILSSGIIILLILQALNFLNPGSFILVVILTIVILKSFSKRKGFFYQTRIPKLSKLAKQK